MTTNNAGERVIVGLGEILWDLLPDGARMGGAPANFAFHAAQLGHESRVVSRVGMDPLGDEIIKRLRSLGLSAEGVQRDSEKATGTVEVHIGEAGEPHYEIVENVAWDDIEWNESVAGICANTAVVCFGSLAQRAERSRDTILRYLQSVSPDCVRVYDVNMRGSYCSREILMESCKHTDILKVNDHEIARVAELLSIPYRHVSDQADWLLERYKLKLIVVTRGAEGSFLLNADGKCDHPGVKANVQDTIGAGDAFTAAVSHHYLKGSSLEEMSDAANRMGAMVASSSGATPQLTAEFLSTIR